MNTLSIGLYVVDAVVCIFLIIIVLMQKSKSSGLSGVFGGSNDTFWAKNQGKSLEGNLEKYTKIGITLFFVLTVVINVAVYKVNKSEYYKNNPTESTTQTQQTSTTTNSTDTSKTQETTNTNKK